MTAVWFLAGFATACVCWVAASCLWGPRPGGRGRGGTVDLTGMRPPYDHEIEGDCWEPTLTERDKAISDGGVSLREKRHAQRGITAHSPRRPASDCSRSVSAGLTDEAADRLWRAIDLQAVVDEANREGAA